MTKKDYILIAKTLVYSQLNNPPTTGHFIFNWLRNDFCEALKKENPKFNAKKFKEYIIKMLKKGRVE